MHEAGGEYPRSIPHSKSKVIGHRLCNMTVFNVVSKSETNSHPIEGIKFDVLKIIPLIEFVGNKPLNSHKKKEGRRAFKTELSHVHREHKTLEKVIHLGKSMANTQTVQMDLFVFSSFIKFNLLDTTFLRKSRP